MNTVIYSSRPLKWNGKLYQIVKAGISGNVAFAETEPKEPELEAKLKEMIKKDRNLTFYPTFRTPFTLKPTHFECLFCGSTGLHW